MLPGRGERIRVPAEIITGGISERRRRRRGIIKQRRDVNGMIVLGVVLLILGVLTGVGILWSIGVLLILIGAVLWILGAVGHQVGGRRHYY
jgi:hypothetical protein